MTNIKPLAPGEIRTATAEDGTTVTMLEVAGGSFIQVRAQRPGHLIFCHTWTSNLEHTALYEYGRLCRAYSAS